MTPGVAGGSPPLMPDDPALATMERLSERIADRTLSPVALVDHVLNRIADLDLDLHAYVTVDASGSRSAAEEAEREIARFGPRGPLHGIPVAIKDNLDVAGLPTTNGSPLTVGNLATRDAAVVERLRAAGAVVIGKTALHEWAMGGTCTRQPGGPVRNPWDLARVPGGSSGGSAVAVATGMAVAAIGTDGMGSVRTPASYCGVVGLKPTRGLVSRYGVVPPTSSAFDQIGCFGRSVADVGTVLDAIAGADPRDPTSRTAAAARSSDLGRLTVGRVVSPLLDDVVDPVRLAVDAAAAAFAAAGATVGDVPLARLEQAPLLATGVLSEAQALLLPFARSRLDAFANPDIRSRILANEFVRAADVRRARQLAGALTAEVEAALGRYDVLLLPTNTTPAFPIDATDVAVGGDETVDLRRPGGQARITTRLGLPFNATGLPAVSVPATALVNGMPVGIQLVGRRWADRTLLAIARVLETAGHRWHPPPVERSGSPSRDPSSTQAAHEERGR